MSPASPTKRSLIPLFADMLACKIAWHCCEEITQSNQKKADIEREYDKAKADAKRINAFEQATPQEPEPPWLTARPAIAGKIGCGSEGLNAESLPDQSSFSTGKSRPCCTGKVEFDNYKSALKVCRNWLPLIQGPVTRRPATYFCDEVKIHRKRFRLVRFKYSTLQAYMLEFGTNTSRFKRNNLPVTLAAQNITAATKANPCVVTYSGSDTYANRGSRRYRRCGRDDRVERASVPGHKPQQRQTRSSSKRSTVQILTARTTGPTPRGHDRRSLRDVSPYDEDQLFELKFVQSADVLYITHPEHTRASSRARAYLMDAHRHEQRRVIGWAVSP